MNATTNQSSQFIAQLKNIESEIQQGRLQSAASQLNVCHQMYPNDPRPFLLGSVLAQAANNSEAMLLSAQRASQLAPGWATATIHLATVLTDIGKNNEAISAIELAIHQFEGLPDDRFQLLERAASLAYRLSKFDLALLCLAEAAAIRSADSNIKYKQALTLNAKGDTDAAIAIFSDLLILHPENQMLLSLRMQAYLKLDLKDLALLDVKRLVSIDSENEEYKFYLKVANGDTPAQQPVGGISRLFDGFASSFDQQLVVGLQYKLPRDVAQMIHIWHSDRNGDVLDLGCGTGLLGACLGPINGVLVGVDLSSEMLAQAVRHNVYDRFHQVNLLDALVATPGDLYHVIAALDTFVYVGSLDTVIPNAYRILVNGGRFVFSCEAASEDESEYTLTKSYRYRHHRRYVEHLLSSAGFENISIENRVIRTEAGQPVQGFLVTACKPAITPEKTVRKRPKNAKPELPQQE